MAVAAPVSVEHPSQQLVQDLAAEVEGVLWSHGPLRESDATIRVTSSGGVITLEGNVRTQVMKALAARLARTVPGVKEVVNHLVADSEIESQVAQALASDPDTQLLTDSIVVKSLNGRVLLTGTIAADAERTAAIRQRAGELVQAVTGVRQVINDLRAAA